jgi:hypothetical protein
MFLRKTVLGDAFLTWESQKEAPLVSYAENEEQTRRGTEALQVSGHMVSH